MIWDPPLSLLPKCIKCFKWDCKYFVYVYSFLPAVVTLLISQKIVYECHVVSHRFALWFWMCGGSSYHVCTCCDYEWWIMLAVQMQKQHINSKYPLFLSDACLGPDLRACLTLLHAIKICTCISSDYQLYAKAACFKLLAHCNGCSTSGKIASNIS